MTHTLVNSTTGAVMGTAPSFRAACIMLNYCQSQYRLACHVRPYKIGDTK